MYAVRQAPKNSTARGQHNGPAPKMGSGRADRVFKKPSKGSGAVPKMGHSAPGSKTGK